VCWKLVLRSVILYHSILVFTLFHTTLFELILLLRRQRVFFILVIKIHHLFFSRGKLSSPSPSFFNFQTPRCKFVFLVILLAVVNPFGIRYWNGHFEDRGGEMNIQSDISFHSRPTPTSAAHSRQKCEEIKCFLFKKKKSALKFSFTFIQEPFFPNPASFLAFLNTKDKNLVKTKQEEQKAL